MERMIEQTSLDNGRTWHYPLWIALFLGFISLTGCGGSPDNQWIGRIEIIDGVQRIMNDAPMWHAPDSSLQVVLTEDLVIPGQANPAEHAFASVYGITTDRQGNIYLADAERSRVLKFGPDGAYIAAIGSRGTGPLQFVLPVDVAVDAQDRLYVLDNELNRVTSFNADLTLADIWDTPVVRPRRIRVDAEGNVLVFALTQHEEIYKFKPNGEFIKEFYDPKESLRIMGNMEQWMAYSDAAIETTDDGYVYVSSRHPYWIRKFDRVAGLEREFTRVTPFEIKPLDTWPGNEQPPPVGLSGALAVFPNGRIMNIIQYQEFDKVGLNSLGRPKVKLTKVDRWFDFFTAEGKWEMTSKIKVSGFPMHVDRKGRIYFYEGDPLRVVRYTVAFPEGVE
jgi:hypothetical protein